MVLPHEIPPDFRGDVYIYTAILYANASVPRVYRVTQMLTDGVHCREPVGHGASTVTGAVLAGHPGPTNARLSFPTPTLFIISIIMEWAC